jgi:threonine/homoserine/homoserine lactone efflux protein
MGQTLLLTTIRSGSAGSLVLTSLAIMGSPGPATISLTAAGSVFGIRRSFGYLTGIVAGSTIVLLAVGTGITAALLAVPALRVALIALSVVYIVRLAYRIAVAPPLLAEGPVRGAPTLTGGLFLGVANPKAWVAIAAVFVSSRLAGSATVDAAGKIVLLTVMIVVINTTWLAAGASLAPWFRDSRRARTINVTLAVALVVSTALALLH